MIYDIGIIGAGPIGLFVPFIAGIKKLTCITFESLNFVGGQCSALYPEKPIYDIPGFPAITAQDLISNLQEQSKKFNSPICLSESVVSYTKEGEIFILKTSQNREFKVRSVVFSTGGGKFVPFRPPLENIEDFEGKSVFYSVTNKSFFKHKNIAIAGGGDSAVDWALSLSEIANKIYFIHRRDKFRASPESIASLEELASDGRVEFIVPFQLKSLEGQDGILKKLTVATLKGEERVLEVDTLLPFFGLMTDSSLVDIFGLKKNQDGYVSVQQNTMQTSTDRIYAVGDIAHYEGKLKLILSGFAEVASAVYDIKKILYPNEIERFEYSTSIFAK